MTRIVFMGTPDFAVPGLQALIRTRQVVGVVTQPDKPAGRGKQLRPSPIKVVAQAASIPLYQPKSLRSEAAAAPLRAWQPDIIIVAAFGQILRPRVLDLPPHGCLNIHASLLPRWRGASPIQHAILAGDAETGVTLMRMDAGLDTGPMLAQQAIPIHADETAASLHDRLAELGAEMLETRLDDILHGRLPPIAQNDDDATYAPLIKKEDGRLDWTKTAAELDRHIRAMTPWPGAFTEWDGRLLKILSAQVMVDPLPPGEPGEVVMAGDTAVIRTREGGICPEKLQSAGKRAMSAADFLRGRPEFIGSKLGI